MKQKKWEYNKNEDRNLWRLGFENRAIGWFFYRIITISNIVIVLQDLGVHDKKKTTTHTRISENYIRSKSKRWWIYVYII